MKEGIADSLILMHYDNGHSSAIDWWATRLEEGWEINISLITCMERLKGVSGLQYRIHLMLKDKKIHRILPITRCISELAHSLLEQYCLKYTPTPRRDRMEALICDIFIAATSLKYKLVLFTQNLSHFQCVNKLNVKEADYNIEGNGVD